MTILVWLILGFTIGLSASRLADGRDRGVPVELTLGLAASIVGGLLAILLG